jgi:hypothetical protein
MSENAIIGFPTHTALSTPGAWTGAWAAAWPIGNVNELPLGRVARSVDVAPASTKFEMLLPRELPVQMVTLINHNASNDATVRVRVYGDTGATLLLWDSGPGLSGTGSPFWPAVYNTLDLEWEDPRWWDGKYSEDEKIGNIPILPLIAPAPVAGRLIRVEVTDSLNPDGYFQVGYVDVAAVWQPTVNFRYGAQYGLIDRTAALEAEGGALYFNERGDKKVFRGSIDYLPRLEARGKAFEMQRQMKTSRPFVWVPFPNRSETLLTQSFLAFNAGLDPIEMAFFDRDTVPLNFTEVR